MVGDVGIVIPAYRPDPERLATYIESLWESIEPDRIHVELDIPTRATLAVLEDSPATVRVANIRRGKGAAITAGFDHVDTSVLAFVDADGSTPPTSVAAVIAAVRASDAGLSVGSRRHPEAAVTTHQTRFRRRLGDLFVRIAQRSLPVHLTDYQCGVKAIERETWRSIRGDLLTPGFGWDVEFVSLGAIAGARVVEVPIAWEDRPGSTVPIVGTTSDFALALLRARRRTKSASGDRWYRRLDRLLGRPEPLIAREEFRSYSPSTGSA